MFLYSFYLYYQLTGESIRPLQTLSIGTVFGFRFRFMLSPLAGARFLFVGALGLFGVYHDSCQATLP